MGHEVSTWRAGILSVRPKMVNCSYEAYRENSSLIREKTNAFYERARVLNRSLDESTALKPAVKNDDGTSGAEAEDANDPFQEEIPNIMADVERSVTKYADEMAKEVLEHTGGADISSYLGHIFSTRLNFQTSMWQLVTLEAVYLPTIMREHLRRDASTLHLFVECLPTLVPCAIPPPPLSATPTTTAIKALSIGATKVSRPLLVTTAAGANEAVGTVKTVPASSASQGATTTTQKPTAAPRVKLKVSPAATNTVLDKAVGHVAPVPNTHSAPSQSSTPAGRLASLAQASSNVRSCSQDSISPNSQPTVKQPRLDGNVEPAVTSSSTLVSSSAAAITVDEDEDEIQFIDAIDDGTSVRLDAQGRQMTTSSTSSTFTLQPLANELVSEYPEGVRVVINRLRSNQYSADLPWMQDLRQRVPQNTRNDRNVDSMVAHVLAKQQHNVYMRNSFKSVDRILNSDEDPDFFDENFKSVLTNVCRNQPFKSPSYCNMKNFQFDYLLACFLDDDDNPFPTNDKRFRMQIMGLSSLHSVGALSRPKVHTHGMSIEIFCPHCGYHSNNPNTVNTHICMHYHAGMFCAHKGCNCITNKPDAMAEHGESHHSYGTRNKTPSKTKK